MPYHPWKCHCVVLFCTWDLCENFVNLLKHPTQKVRRHFNPLCPMYKPFPHIPFAILFLFGREPPSNSRIHPPPFTPMELKNTRHCAVMLSEATVLHPLRALMACIPSILFYWTISRAVNCHQITPFMNCVPAPFGMWILPHRAFFCPGIPRTKIAS